MVKFDRLKLHRVRLPLRQPWKAAGLQLDSVETLLLEAEDDQCTVWVESTPFAAPVFTSEWAAASFQLARDWIAPRVLGKSFFSAENLTATLAPFHGAHYAKALFDQAYWQLESAKAGRSVASLLGSQRELVRVSQTLGIFSSIDALLAATQLAVDQGFETLKLKFCPGWELEPLKAVRSAFPKLNLLIDCNAMYSLEHESLFRSLDPLGLTMIEQPLPADDLVGHAKLAKDIATPICLDESASSLLRVRNAIELKSCQVIHIKLSRVGGLTAAKAIHDVCKNAGIACTIGSNLESAIGSELVTAFASLPGFIRTGTIFPTSHLYDLDLADSPLTLTRDPQGVPAVEVNLKPGGQRKPDAARLKSWTIEFAQLE